MKRFSVVIVSYNTKDILCQALHSVSSQLDFEVDELIVVDNNSSDGSREAVLSQYPSTTLIGLDKNYGYSYAVNRGFDCSTGAFLFVMNSDILCPPALLSSLLDKMNSHSHVGAIGPELTDHEGGLSQLTWQWEVTLWGELLNKLFSPKFIERYKIIRSLVPYLQKRERTVPWMSGAAFLVRRETMQAIGGFDEQFQFYYEDADLFKRIGSAGYTVVFTPDLKAVHGLGQSSNSNRLKILLMFVQSRLAYYKKHRTWLERKLLLLYLRLKFHLSSHYRENGGYREWVDTILNEKRIIPLWQDL